MNIARSALYFWAAVVQKRMIHRPVVMTFMADDSINLRPAQFATIELIKMQVRQAQIE
jgi:hypothetical protein